MKNSSVHAIKTCLCIVDLRESVNTCTYGVVVITSIESEYNGAMTTREHTGTFVLDLQGVI